MSTIERGAPKHGPCSASKGDMELTIHGLGGIFWALNQFVVHHVADDVAREKDLRGGIDALILAGLLLTEEVKRRF